MDGREGRRLGAADALAAAALLATVAALFHGILAGRGLFFERQFVGQFWAMRADAWARLLATGELPLWTPRIFMGLPLLAQANWGLLDPLNVPAFAMFGGPEALNFLIVLDWSIAALGAYALLRGLGLGAAASAVGALLMTFTPYALDDAGSLHHAGSRAWAPWALLALVRVAERGSVRWAVALGGFYALALMAGGFNFLIGANFVFAGVALSLILRALRRSPSGALQLVALYGLAGAVAAGLAAAQLLPTLELLPHTPRGQMGLPESLQGGHTVRVADQLAAWRDVLYAPDAARAGMLATFEADRLVDPLTAALFLVGLALCWRRPIFGAVALVTALLYLMALGEGTPLYAWVYDLGLPGMGYFKMPQKLLHGFYLGAAIVAAGGLDRLLRGFSRRGTAVARTLAALVAAALLLGFLFAESSDGLDGRALARSFAGALGLALALGAALLAAGSASGLRRNAAAALLFAVVAVGQLALYGRNAFPLTPREDVDKLVAPDALAAAVRKEEGHPRVFRLGIQRELEAFTNLWAPFGIDEAGGFASMAPERALAYSLADSGVPTLQQYAAPEFLFHEGMRRAAGVKFLVADRRFLKARERELLGNRAGEPLAVDEPLVLYSVQNALPRAYLVANSRTRTGPDAALEAVASDDFDPSREVVLESGTETEGALFAPARLKRYDATHVEVSLPEIAAPAWLVLADAFYPGWKATADGEAREILRANSLFRAVAVRPGDREISFQYDPASFRLGAFLGILTATASLLLVMNRKIGHG